MKKKIIAICIMAVIAVFVFAEPAGKVQPKTKRYEIETRPSATIVMTEIIALEYLTEFYLIYEEDNNMYSEAEAEKVIFEFISEFKRTNNFSRVEVEDLKAAAVGKTKTTIQKRVIFRQLRK